MFYYVLGQRCDACLVPEVVIDDFHAEKCQRVPTKRTGSSGVQTKTCLVMKNGSDVSKGLLMDMLDYAFYNLASQYGRQKTNNDLKLPLDARRFSVMTEAVDMDVQNMRVLSRRPLIKDTPLIQVSFVPPTSVKKPIRRRVTALVRPMVGNEVTEIRVWQVTHMNPV